MKADAPNLATDEPRTKHGLETGRSFRVSSVFHPWLKKLLLVLLLLPVLALTGRWLFFCGPYLAPEPLPEARLLDMHCHVAGIGAGGSGCFVSEAISNSWKFGLYLEGFGTTRAEVLAEGDRAVVRRISEQVASSRHIGAAIVLAIDGVVDERGELDRSRTEIYVPNEFVAQEVARHTNLLFGASINPYRRDALERLVWAKAHGARLVKWIPSVMQIDPADPRLEPFYRKLVELRLPLLTHTGCEKAFTTANNKLADPERLRLPLRLGVTVIAAHIASTGEINGERDADRLRRLFAEYPNLYADISSLTQVNKLGYLREALQKPEYRGRLLYGTDFPLIAMPLVSPYYFPLNLRFGQMRAIAAMPNPWDRDVALKQALGVPREVFERPAKMFPHRATAQNPAGQSPKAIQLEHPSRNGERTRPACRVGRPAQTLVAHSFCDVGGSEFERRSFRRAAENHTPAACAPRAASTSPDLDCGIQVQPKDPT